MSDVEDTRQEDEHPSEPENSNHILHPHQGSSVSSVAHTRQVCSSAHPSQVPNIPATHYRDWSGSSGPGEYQSSAPAGLSERLDELASSDEESEEIEDNWEERKPTNPVGLASETTTSFIASPAPDTFSNSSAQMIRHEMERNSEVASISQRLPSRQSTAPVSNLLSTSELAQSIGHTRHEQVLVPRIDVEDNENGYIFERPTRTRARTDSDDEERHERPSKRVRMQSPELPLTQTPRSTRQISIKHSGGRRTRGFTRRR
jgi:hypothetical protein